MLTLSLVAEHVSASLRMSPAIALKSFLSHWPSASFGKAKSEGQHLPAACPGVWRLWAFPTGRPAV